jgi:Type IV secretion system pilin/Transglycosylase SLT domain
MWKISLGTILVALPLFVSAAGLIPCGGNGEEPCQTCHVVQLITNITDWLALILGIILSIMIIYSGFRMVTSSGDVSAKSEAKKIITNGIIGYMIVLAGWLLVDVGLKTMVDDQTYGAWNAIQCVAQPTAVKWSRPTASGDNAADLPAAGIDARIAAIAASGDLQAKIAAAAAAAGIKDQDQIDTLRALISQESSNCTNKVGPPTSSGTAYGCGQMLVSTARTLDPGLKGLTDAEVAAKLRDDNAYNLSVSAKYYSQLLNRYAGNTDLALAAYNGGPGANQPSSDCPGQKRWQCVWDSPGCYGTGKVDCKKNEGPNSYAQTRHYVTNINKIADGL